MRSVINLLSLLLLPSIFFGQSIDVFNATSVADIIEKNSARYKSFSGTFVYRHAGKSFNGTIIYVAPNKLMMEFKNKNKRIVSDSQYIWIQEGDIIARQPLGKVSSPMMAWNIKRLRQQYIATAPAEGLETTFGSVPAYKIIFEPKVNTTSFRRIELISDRKGLIRQMKGISRVGKETTLTISYQDFNKSYDKTVFSINTSEDSQIYDNIFN